MKTAHTIVYDNARTLKKIPSASIDLVVTSPPYPMIEMWDDIFSQQHSPICKSLAEKNGTEAFDYMHHILDSVWDEVYRVMKPGGIAAINIGDATRTLNGHFMLYSNHSRVLSYLLNLGFSALPAILWRKQTNAPNKFMGSGMLPPGAYVTLEHEYILILRKGNKKNFSTPAAKRQRHESAFFWEERNNWFSDVWMDLKGTSQFLFDAKTRKRSAAYPFELPYRIISMFSIKGDLVLDPFLGIGTTMFAAMAAGRNSIGYEIETGFKPIIESRTNGLVEYANQRIQTRLKNHLAFIQDRFEKKGLFKYQNAPYGFPVVTRQETHLLLNTVQKIVPSEANGFEVTYSTSPQPEFIQRWDNYIVTAHSTGNSK